MTRPPTNLLRPPVLIFRSPAVTLKDYVEPIYRELSLAKGYSRRLRDHPRFGGSLVLGDIGALRLIQLLRLAVELNLGRDAARDKAFSANNHTRFEQHRHWRRQIVPPAHPSLAHMTTGDDRIEVTIGLASFTSKRNLSLVPPIEQVCT